MKTAARASFLPARHPLAQAIALALALGAGATQADVFNVTSNADNGSGSLRQAVAIANATPRADQITFSDGVGTIALTSGQIDITETLTITGPAGGQTVDAGGNSRILAVTVAGQPLTLENLTLIGGETTADGDLDTTCADDTGEGGGICALGDVTLTNSTVSDNSTVGVAAYGGGLFVVGDAILTNSSVRDNSTAGKYAEGGGLLVGGNATLTNSIVSGNSTAGDYAAGGGLNTYKAMLTNSTVSGNSTVGDHARGGGVHTRIIPLSELTLIKSTISGNSTAGIDAVGGGLFIAGDATLINSTVSGNTTTGLHADGGGLFVVGDAMLTNSIVSGNSTAGDYAAGGGGWIFNGDATLTNSTVSGNSTAGSGSGGGLGVLRGNATLTNSSVSNNSAVGVAAYGGGLFVVGDAILTSSSVSGNSTAGNDARGGGLAVLRGHAMLTNSIVSGNSTAGDYAAGGGLSVSTNGSATLTNSTVSGNTTSGFSARGGGFIAGGFDSVLTLTNSTVSGNSALGSRAYGGGISFLFGDASLRNSTITGNQSAAGAGGLHIEALDDQRTLTLASAVLAANSGPEGNFDFSGSITLDASNSLFGDDPSEINGVNIDNIFTDTPGVGLLADNGCAEAAGASGTAACVQTHALLTGSAAIDAADDTVCIDEPVNGLDQRGETRPADGDSDGIARCDIGAFERQAVTQVIDYDITGSWYNPATDGQGFSLEVVPDLDLMAAYWFTYSVDGSAQMWLAGAGAIDIDFTQVPLQELTGGKFVDPTPPMRIDWGTVTVRFFSESSGEAIYESPADGVDGVIPILRGTPPIACIEADAPPAETIDARFTGSWYDPINDGQGFSLEVIPERNLLVVYWFTYTVDGPAQMWLQGSGPITGETATIELARPIGGQFDDDREPTRPVWGTMTIGFDSATSGEVSYDSPLDGVSGTFPVERITPQAFCE